MIHAASVAVPKDAIFPNHHLAEGPVNINANHASHARLPLVAHDGSGGRHDNYGFALTAQPGESQRRPATNTSSQLIVRVGLPLASPPRADAVKVGGRANHATMSDFARPHLGWWRARRQACMGRAEDDQTIGQRQVGAPQCSLRQANYVRTDASFPVPVPDFSTIWGNGNGNAHHMP